MIQLPVNGIERPLCNRRLLNYKRVHGYLVWDCDFPRTTASMKIKRGELAEQIRASVTRDSLAWP